MNSPVKLLDTQLVILSSASRREDRCLTVPKNLKRPAAEKLATKLLATGLVREIKSKPNMPVWRHDEDAGQGFSLKLTAAGLKAVEIDEDNSQPEEIVGASARQDSSNAVGATERIAAAPPASAASSAKSQPVSSTPRQGTKIARVIELLRRDHGATLEALMSPRAGCRTPRAQP